MRACRKGNVVDKDVFTKDIEKQLTVAPLADPQFGGGFPKKNKYFVWNKNRTRVAMPRFFKHPGLNADDVEESYGRVEDVRDRLVFRGSLKPELRQPEAVEATLGAMRATGGAILSLSPGMGKCFAKGTRVLMYDGSVRCVEDVAVGDAVMGDDWTPRVVASLGRGREMMYDIVPMDGGRPFTCNESHILALIHPTLHTKIDIDVKQCMSLSESTRLRLNMYRCPPDGSIVRTHFNIVKKGIGDYYGFTLAGTEHRFLLADFTVVHNTVCALSVASTIGLKTLIVVHKEFLMNQWIERIKQFVPEARIGRLQQNTVDVDDKEIVVAMIHSIALRSYPEGTFDGFGLTIVDECHHVSAPVFSQAMHVANAPYVLGLTATPERRDGLQLVLHWYLGDISFQTKREHRADVKVDVVRSDIKDISPPINRRTGNICMASFITALTEDAERNRLVMSVIRKYHGQPGRKILVLSDRRFHCDFMLAQCRRLGIDAGLYLGGMSASDLETSASKPVILATYALATEGLDIPTLDTLLLATPKSDVVQATGRILREGFGKVNGPVIIDMVDSFSIFYAQFNKRKAFYTRSGFDLERTEEPKASQKLDFIIDD